MEIAIDTFPHIDLPLPLLLVFMMKYGLWMMNESDSFLLVWLMIDADVISMMRVRWGDSDRHLSIHIDLTLPLLFNVGLYDE